MADQHDVDLDSIIERLLEVRGSRPGKQVQLLETEIRYLCTKAREIFISQPIHLELEAPIKVRYLSASPTMVLERPALYDCRAQSTNTSPPPIRFAAIFMANTTIFSASSITPAFHPRPTTSSSVIISTAESNLLRLFASC